MSEQLRTPADVGGPVPTGGLKDEVLTKLDDFSQGKCDWASTDRYFMNRTPGDPISGPLDDQTEIGSWNYSHQGSTGVPPSTVGIPTKQWWVQNIRFGTGILQRAYEIRSLSPFAPVMACWERSRDLSVPDGAWSTWINGYRPPFVLITVWANNWRGPTAQIRYFGDSRNVQLKGYMEHSDGTSIRADAWENICTFPSDQGFSPGEQVVFIAPGLNAGAAPVTGVCLLRVNSLRLDVISIGNPCNRVWVDGCQFYGGFGHPNFV